MKVKHVLLGYLLLSAFLLHAQNLTLKKGIIIDSLKVKNTKKETFNLFLPTSFNLEKSCPVIYVVDLKGQTKEYMKRLLKSADKKGFVLAGSNNLKDTASLSNNMLVIGRMMRELQNILPINKSEMYTAGYETGGRFASIVPVFINEVDGAIAIGSSLSNTEVLSAKNRFNFIGIIGDEDYNYIPSLVSEKALNAMKYPNHLLVFDGGHEWPEEFYIDKALDILKLSAASKQSVPLDSGQVKVTFNDGVQKIRTLVAENKLLLANRLMLEMITAYRNHTNTDSLKQARKELRKLKTYRSLKRKRETAMFKESLLAEDYLYYLEDDIIAANFKNLGWWNYQMEELNKFVVSGNKAEQKMGKRLKGFLNALVVDNIEVISAEKKIDEEALIFLWMLKTLTEPNNHDNYLEVVSLASKKEDFGTALFYLEEVLKIGFKDTDKLYSLEHTALLRITPEFNTLVEQYLKKPRYNLKIQE